MNDTDNIEPIDEEIPPPGDEDAPTDEAGLPPDPADDHRPDAGAKEDSRVDPATGEILDDESGEDPIATIMRILGGVAETLEKQQERLDELEDMLTATPDGPWAWASLSGQERAKLWKRLYEWVTWLEDRYLRHLSPSRHGVIALVADWYRHPVAVELLTALMVAHIATYRKKASPPSFTLVEWHERALWPTLARMEDLGLFPIESERENWEGPEQRPTRRNDDRFEQWLEADLNAHPADARPKRSTKAPQPAVPISEGDGAGSITA